MENITLGQIAATLSFIVGIIGSIKYLKKELDESINNSIKKLLDPISEDLRNVELSSIKADLVNFISDVEAGVHKTTVQIMNAHELYDRYKKRGGNSYVEEHWEKLEKEGKI